MDNYYVFHVEGSEAKEYLCGTNLVGVWEENLVKAEEKVRSYFKQGTTITLISKGDAKEIIGYLH